MRFIVIAAIMALLMPMIFCDKITNLMQYARASSTNAGCINFTPLTASGTDCGVVANNVPAGHVDALLDRILQDTPFRCLQMYGLDTSAVAAAKAKGFKVIIVLFLDWNVNLNTATINNAISAATNPSLSDAIIGWSCGNEMRQADNTHIVEPVINDCIDRLRNGGVPQAITTNSIYYAWCNFEPNSPWCSRWNSMANKVDYIGTNIYPFYDNKYIPNNPGACVTALQAAQKTLSYYQLTKSFYQDKEVIVTEWGWPAGPDGFFFSDCNNVPSPNPYNYGVASETNQNMVVHQTMSLFRANNIGSVLFSSHRNPCKISEEPFVGPYWGVCYEQAPYYCKQNIYG